MIAALILAATDVVEPSACGADRAASLVGRPYDDATRAAARGIAGRDRVRFILPGDAVTMDYAPARLNVEIGKDGRVRHVRCG